MTRHPDVAMDPDLARIERARAGDRAAFDELVQEHLAVVWRVVYRVVRNAADAEDVTQEVFLAAWQALPGFRGEARFSTWLHQVAISRALNWRARAGERLRRASVPIEPVPGAEPVVATWDEERDAQSPLARLEHRELQRRLARCLEKLPPLWRAILALRDGEGLSYDEIAASAEVPIGTVRSRLARARLNLRACLKGREAEEAAP